MQEAKFVRLAAAAGSSLASSTPGQEKTDVDNDAVACARSNACELFTEHSFLEFGMMKKRLEKGCDLCESRFDIFLWRYYFEVELLNIFLPLQIMWRWPASVVAAVTLCLYVRGIV